MQSMCTAETRTGRNKRGAGGWQWAVDPRRGSGSRAAPGVREKKERVNKGGQSAVRSRFGRADRARRRRRRRKKENEINRSKEKKRPPRGTYRRAL